MVFSRSLRVVVLVSLGAIALGGCGHPAERKLQGRWFGEGIESLGADDLSAATGWVKGTSFLFRGEQMTVEVPAEAPRSGKFQVLTYRDGKMTVSVQRQDGTSDRVDLKLDDDRSMRWLLSEGRAVVMRRVD